MSKKQKTWGRTQSNSPDAISITYRQVQMGGSEDASSNRRSSQQDLLRNDMVAHSQSDHAHVVQGSTDTTVLLASEPFYLRVQDGREHVQGLFVVSVVQQGLGRLVQFTSSDASILCRDQGVASIAHRGDIGHLHALPVALQNLGQRQTRFGVGDAASDRG